LDYLPPSSPPPLSPASGWESFYDDESNEQFEETSSDKCQGQLIEWVAGSVWDTYAYQQHDNDSIGEFHYQTMQYGRAKTPSKNTPCTNVPLNCPICPTGQNGRKTTFWKYQFMTHMIQRHLSESNELPFIPLQLLVTTHITQGEEVSMGIPNIKTQSWRDENQVLDSDQIRIIEEEDVEDEEDDTSEDEMEDQTIQEPYEETVGRRSRKRGMSMASTASRQGSPQKKQHQGY